MNNANNNEMNLAWQLLSSTDVSVFLTGKAGTGKTTFLRRLRQLTPKRMVVLAPTGVAAINANGQTIHSFFQLPFGPNVPGSGDTRKSFRMNRNKLNLIRTLDLLVIDEISMVRCDLLDAVDAELRKHRDRYKPFGGVQLLLIGDLQQLAPVAKENEWNLLRPYYATPYFFSSKALEQLDYVTVELKHIYRQQDVAFIDILAKIRNNSLDEATLTALNRRYIPDFHEDSNDRIRLTTHNRMADDFNANRLAELPDKAVEFKARVKGNFPESSYPAEEKLVLKPGAQVMFIKNDPSGSHAYYNGKMGVVKGFNADGIEVWSQEDGETIIVPRVTWENTRFTVDEITKDITEEVEGVFCQYPLRLAWAITIHKSQGLTFDHAVLDINESFAHGQAYVALSRCRSLEGLVLSAPVSRRAIITDRTVDEFIDRTNVEARSTINRLPSLIQAYKVKLLDEMFDYTRLDMDLRHLQRIVDENLRKRHSDYLEILNTAIAQMREKLIDVSVKFASQYRLLLAEENSEKLDERLNAAIGYFLPTVHEILDPVVSNIRLDVDNKQTATRLENAIDAFILSFNTKVGILKELSTNGFSVKNYLQAKAHAVLASEQGDDLTLPRRKTPSDKKSRKRREGNYTYSSKREQHAEANQPWTADDENRLLQQRALGKSIADLAKEFGRTPGAIRNRLRSLNSK